METHANQAQGTYMYRLNEKEEAMPLEESLGADPDDASEHAVSQFAEMLRDGVALCADNGDKEGFAGIVRAYTRLLGEHGRLVEVKRTGFLSFLKQRQYELSREDRDHFNKLREDMDQNIEYYTAVSMGKMAEKYAEEGNAEGVKEEYIKFKDMVEASKVKDKGIYDPEGIIRLVAGAEINALKKEYINHGAQMDNLLEDIKSIDPNADIEKTREDLVAGRIDSMQMALDKYIHIGPEQTYSPRELMNLVEDIRWHLQELPELSSCANKVERLEVDANIVELNACMGIYGHANFGEEMRQGSLEKAQDIAYRAADDFADRGNIEATQFFLNIFRDISGRHMQELEEDDASIMKVYKAVGLRSVRAAKKQQFTAGPSAPSAPGKAQRQL